MKNRKISVFQADLVTLHPALPVLLLQVNYLMGLGTTTPGPISPGVDCQLLGTWGSLGWWLQGHCRDS